MRLLLAGALVVALVAWIASWLGTSSPGKSTGVTKTEPRTTPARERTRREAPVQESVAAAAAEPDEADEHLSVNVFDASGRAVGGAHVWVRGTGSEGWGEPLTTGAEGVAGTTFDRAVRVDYVVRADGRAVAFADDVGCDVDGVVHVALEPGRRVEGTLRTRDGSLVRERVKVVAWPSLTALRTAPARALADPRATVVESSETGHFVLDGLQPARYRAFAVGDGWHSPNPSPAVIGAEATSVDLLVAPLYALAVDLVDGIDPALPLPSTVFLPASGCESPAGARALDVKALAAVVSGLEARRAGPSRGGERFVTFFTGTGEAQERLGPVTLRSVRPGYMPVRESLPVHRVRASGTPVHRIELRRTPEFEAGQGEIVVEYDLAGVAPELRETTRELARAGQRFASVTLQPTTERVDHVRQVFRQLPLRLEPRVVLEEIPAGTYRFLISAPTPDSTFLLEGKTVEVAPGEPAVVRIRARPGGHLRFLLPAEASAGPVPAGVRIYLRRLDLDKGTYVDVNRPPFEIPFVAAGAYRVTWRRSGVRFERTVEVVVGQVTTVDLRE